MFINDRFLAYDGVGDSMVGDYADNVQFSAYDPRTKCRFRELFPDESILRTETSGTEAESRTTWTLPLESCAETLGNVSDYKIVINIQQMLSV